MTFREYALKTYNIHYIRLQLRVLYRFLQFFFMSKEKKRKLLDQKLMKAQELYGTEFVVKTIPRALQELQHEHEDMYGYELGIFQLEGY